MSDNELEAAIETLQSPYVRGNTLRALVLIRRQVEWPRDRGNVATLRSKGCLKQLTNILLTSVNKACIDTSLSILGNCLMDRNCAREAVAQHNIISVLNQVHKKYPKDDSVQGRILRIIGNMCQHRDQWANIIIDRKPALVTNTVVLLTNASKEEPSEDEIFSDATIISALRVSRQLLNNCTITPLVQQFRVLRAVGALFINYSNKWTENKEKEKVLLDIIRVIHEYSKYRQYNSILEMRKTERGDALIHLTTVLLLSPKQVVKIVMNFIKSCQLKSELPVHEICMKFIEALENQSVLEQFADTYTEYLQCLCFLLDHPGNRNVERCGRAVPVLIKVLAEFKEPSNSNIECCMLLINTLNKFKYDSQLLLQQLRNGIVGILVDKFAWVIGSPKSMDLQHTFEKKRKYDDTVSFISTRQKKADSGIAWGPPSPSYSDDDATFLVLRTPSPCFTCSDGESGFMTPCSSGASPSSTFGHESDSDNYSPICSDEDDENSLERGLIESFRENHWDPLPAVPDLEISFETDPEEDKVLKPSLKEGLRIDITNLIKDFAELKPAAIQLANMDLLIQLAKCSMIDKNTKEHILLDILKQHKNLIPLMNTDFISVIRSMMDVPVDHYGCQKCSFHAYTARIILRQIAEVAESAAGVGDIAHQLMRGSMEVKKKLVMVIPYVVSNRSILGKFMLNCGGLDVLINILREEKDQDNSGSLTVLCRMATYRLLIANPKEVSSACPNRLAFALTIEADKYELRDSCENVVAFILDDGSVVKADRNFLIEKSDFFNRLLDGHFKERAETEVCLSNVDNRSFRCLLHLLQAVDKTETIDVELDLETLLDVIMLCDRYLLLDLCMALTDSVEQFRISTGNVPLIYNWSIQSRTNLLRVECVAFVLVVNVDEQERMTMFKNLFALGHKEQLLEDMKNLLGRYLAQSDLNQRVTDSAKKRKHTRHSMRDQLLKDYVS